jgi:signal transduction histidine kinase
MIIYSITNLEIFNIRLIGSQLLAYVLIILVGSQFFFLQNSTERTLTILTFLLSLCFGILLVRSGKKEAEAREKVEKLATELERANAKLRELDRQKDAVLHMVAHQFKGPVSTINFITELLLDGTYGKLNHEQKENITNIRDASQNMGDQSEMVLTAAQITLGKKLPIEPIPLDLNSFFKAIITSATIQAEKRKVNLKVTIPKKLPTVLLDRKFTQIAIDNLLSNAIKYTALKPSKDEGNVDFIIEIKNNTLFCIVKDTGVGIPDKDKNLIFKELSRASNAGKEGTGLGLHVAMGAIQSQGGKIRYESTENVGTTFYIELPLTFIKAKPS